MTISIDSMNRLQCIINGITGLIESGYYNPDNYEELPLIQTPDSFVKRIQQEKLFPLIAEMKLSSPTLRYNTNATEKEKINYLHALMKANITGISVLTEPNHFLGKLDYLREVRKNDGKIPLLMKDIIISKEQILCAKKLGSSTVLLITKIFETNKLKKFVTFAKDHDLEVLLEINTEKEMSLALETHCDLIGINNRDLTTFNVDLGTTERLLKKFRNIEQPVLALSGIKTPEDAKRMKNAGVDGILVGTALTRAKNPQELINNLRGV